jgi:signal peptidase I
METRQNGVAKQGQIRKANLLRYASEVIDPLMIKTESYEAAEKFIRQHFDNKAHGSKLHKGKSNKKRRGIFSVISDILFYIAIFTVVVVILISGEQGGKPRMYMGYSYFTVLTGSMQQELPKGSLILVKQTDPKELNVGDNITFIKDAATSVTHKIIDIYDNYDNSGMRGFKTKGARTVLLATKSE